MVEGEEGEGKGNSVCLVDYCYKKKKMKRG
ncbi:putative aminotransferase TAT2 [Iris pallida]|uniref:Aminotransferase TAT2 n=1 Tax=Iris pallida TaxID=29817 RepID=A0AAX6GF63_IRIPA|nr:putative aminotransferase TAT2 [Iris pallida]